MKNNDQLDKLIQESKSNMSTSKAPDHIWENIVEQISNERETKKLGIFQKIIAWFDFSYSTRRVIAITAGTILGILIINSILSPKLITVEQTGTLAIELDDRLLNEYQKYEKTINGYKIDYLDQNILSNNRRIFPYVERLVSLDNTISRCYSALEINPYSETVNRALVSAYQKKIIALEEVNNLIRRVSWKRWS